MLWCYRTHTQVKVRTTDTCAMLDHARCCVEIIKSITIWVMDFRFTLWDSVIFRMAAKAILPRSSRVGQPPAVSETVFAAQPGLPTMYST